MRIPYRQPLKIAVSYAKLDDESRSLAIKKEVVMFFRMRIRIVFLALGTIFFNSLAAYADGPILPIPIRSEKLDSAKIGEIREFWISLPDQYNESSEKYPVLYMMDGDFNFNSGGTDFHARSSS